MRIKLKNGDTTPIEAWCMRHLGARLYWMHDRRGGTSWRIRKSIDMKNRHCWELEIDNEKQALLLMLKFSNEILERNV